VHPLCFGHRVTDNAILYSHPGQGLWVEGL
jgi:hypothetical protein